MKNDLGEMILEKLESYLKGKLGHNYNFLTSNYDNIIQINGVENKKDGENTMFIKIGINKNYKQVYIPNIFIPFELKYQNIGKTMLSLIFNIADSFNYEVFVVDLTESFYCKLLKRGALTCNQPDMLQIVKDTKLV